MNCFQLLFPLYNIRSLINNLFGVRSFNSFPSFTSLSPSSEGMADKSIDSSL